MASSASRVRPTALIAGGTAVLCLAGAWGAPAARPGSAVTAAHIQLASVAVPLAPANAAGGPGGSDNSGGGGGTAGAPTGGHKQTSSSSSGGTASSGATQKTGEADTSMTGTAGAPKEKQAGGAQGQGGGSAESKASGALSQAKKFADHVIHEVFHGLAKFFRAF